MISSCLQPRALLRGFLRGRRPLESKRGNGFFRGDRGDRGDTESPMLPLTPNTPSWFKGLCPLKIPERRENAPGKGEYGIFALEIYISGAFFTIFVTVGLYIWCIISLQANVELNV